ncbi:MAG: TerC family protein [Planctomycetota bacterium]
MPIGSPLLWSIFTVAVVVALAIDFLALARVGARVVTLRAAAIWSLVWIAAAAGFVSWLWFHLGGLRGEPLAHQKTLEFVTGYLIEKALAVDNLFVFLMLITYFRVPPQLHRRVLMLGVLGAIVLRVIMILVGAWLIARFHWILYLFGAFLVYTGVKMGLSVGKEPDLDANPALSWLRRRVRVAADFEGQRLFTTVDGARVLTPFAVVVGLIGVVDVLFAVDSIPAIFAITTDPFIVLTSNVFAILGLRALYFLLAGLHARFHLLGYGLAVVLVFIGVKMLISGMYKIPVVISLGVTVALLAGSILLSPWIPARGSGGSAYPFPPKQPPRDEVLSSPRSDEPAT